MANLKHGIFLACYYIYWFFPIYFINTDDLGPKSGTVKVSKFQKLPVFIMLKN